MQRVLSGFGNKKRYYWEGDHLVCEITEDGTKLEWTCPEQERKEFWVKSGLLTGISAIIYIAALLVNCECNRNIWVGGPSLAALIPYYFIIVGFARMKNSSGPRLSAWFYGMHDRIQVGCLAAAILLGFSAAACIVLILFHIAESGIAAAVLYAVSASLTLAVRKNFMKLRYEKCLSEEKD